MEEGRESAGRLDQRQLTGWGEQPLLTRGARTQCEEEREREWCRPVSIRGLGLSILPPPSLTRTTGLNTRPSLPPPPTLGPNISYTRGHFIKPLPPPPPAHSVHKNIPFPPWAGWIVEGFMTQHRKKTSNGLKTSSCGGEWGSSLANWAESWPV